MIYSLNSGLWWSLTAVLLQCCSDSLKYPEHVLRNTEIHALIPEQQQEQETTWRQTKYLHCSDKQSGTKESVLWLRHAAHAARTVLHNHSWTSCLQYLGRWPFAFRQVKSWKWPWGFPTCCTCLTYPDIHSESPWRLTAHRVWRSSVIYTQHVSVLHTVIVWSWLSLYDPAAFTLRKLLRLPKSSSFPRANRKSTPDTRSRQRTEKTASHQQSSSGTPSQTNL